MCLHVHNCNRRPVYTNKILQMFAELRTDMATIIAPKDGRQQLLRYIDVPAHVQKQKCLNHLISEILKWSLKILEIGRALWERYIALPAKETMKNQQVGIQSVTRKQKYHICNIILYPLWVIHCCKKHCRAYMSVLSGCRKCLCTRVHVHEQLCVKETVALGKEALHLSLVTLCVHGIFPPELA